MNPLDIIKKQNELKKGVEANIQGSLLDEPVLKTLEKAKYQNNAENRKLARVGKEYGGKKKETSNYTLEHLENLVKKEKPDTRHFEDMSDKELKHLNRYAATNMTSGGLNPVTKKRVKAWFDASIREIGSRKRNLSKSVTNNLEKARPSNPSLVLTHIIDKNGKHKVVWKSPEDSVANKSGHKHHEEVSQGHKVSHDGEEQEIHKVKKDGYVTLKRSDGTKHDKSLKKVKFHHPKTGEAESAEFHKDENDAAPASAPKAKATAAEVEDEGLDYKKFGSPAERMEDWVDMVEDFAEGDSKNLTIAYGTGGVGKTFNVLQNQKITDGLESGEYVKFTGGTTPGGFFEMLYENRDKNIILDDFDMIFKDPKMLGLLSTLSRSSEERVVSNPSSSAAGGDIPSRFEFTGKMMVISNIDLEKEAESAGNNSSKYQELTTNSNKVNLKMTKKETWDLINKFILHRDGEINEGLKFQNAYGAPKDVSLKDRKELSEYFEKNWQDMKELSGRTLMKANAIQQYYNEKGGDWKKKADQMLLTGGSDNVEVEERFKDFNDSVDMIARGDLKSAVVVDKNADKIVENLKQKGFAKTSIRGGNELQKQMNPEYVPTELDTFATNMYVTVTGSNLSEKALYETLWKHNGKVVIFDKTAKEFLKSDLGQGLLKGALDTSGDGELTWLSKTNTGKHPMPKNDDGRDELDYQSEMKKQGFSFETLDNGKIDPKTVSHPYDLPKKFNFKGRAVFVTDSTEDAPQPIQSRSMIADIQTTPSEFIKVSKTIAKNRDKNGMQFSHLFGDVSHDEYSSAIKFLEKNSEHVHEKHYSEEGLQTIIGKKRTHTGRGLSSEESDNKIRRQLRKGFDLSGDSYPSVDIMKAFRTLNNL